MAKRLIKIAKELNVGTSTIVEHLVNNGFEIDNKPTAKITDEMYDELLKEFQRSIAIKQEADQLVIGTRPANKKEEAIQEEVIVEELPAPEKEEVIVEEPQNGTHPATSTDQEAPPAVEEKPDDQEETTHSESTPKLKVKVVGKIDLGQRLRDKNANKKQTTAKKSKPAKEVPKAEEVERPAEPAEVDPPESVAVNEANDQHTENKNTEQQAEQAPADTPEATPVQESATTTTPPSTIKTEEKETIVKNDDKEKDQVPPSGSPSSDNAQQERGESEGQATQEDNQTDEQPKHIRAQTPELRGLKILGKIDTDKFKKPKKKKKEQKESPKPSKTEKSTSSSPTDAKKAEAKSKDGGTQKPSTTDDKDPNKKRKRRRRTTITVSNNNSSGGGSGGSSSGGGGSGGNRPQRGQQGRSGGNSRRTTTSKRRDEPKEVSQKEIEEKIKATMARLSGGGKKKRQKLRRENRDRLKERQEAKEQEQKNDKLQLTEFVTVSELGSLMNVNPTDVIMTCMNLGVIVSINQRLEADIIELVAEEFGHEVEFISVEEQTEEEDIFADDPENLSPRAPIVTVMGHVDHGKTSLLDYVRSASVASGEAGGITQHIGAYEVFVGEEKKKITFLDTPGHEAFTAMRARGAKVTDIAVIIIAADDSIMPQTKEAISHAQAAGVPIVFAINKIDKPGAQPDRIKQELASMNLLIEEWGGEHQSHDISAKTGQGIDQLLEKVLLEAEILELKANPNREAVGTVIEASLDKGRGYVTKMLVQTGTLEIGVPIVAGDHSGKVKAMFNEYGKRIKKAGPSTSVLVLGLSGAPQAGDRFKQVDSEQEARQIANKRAQIIREQANRATKRISLDEIGRRLALGNFKELNLIVKGDVDGSVEALSDSLIKQSHETVQVNVIHKAVGQITETDVSLASASDAIIIGFQVRPSLNARRLAEREGVEIKTYSIIYEAIEELKLAIEGMLEPTKEEKIVAQVEVRNTFKISKVGTIAGCYVQEGKISRNSHIRLIRDGIVVYPTKEGVVGEIASLKRFKDDIKEVKAGFECGISIKNFNDIKTDDIIEGYEIVEIKQTLKG